MRRILHGLALGMLVGGLVGLVEGHLAPSLAGEPRAARLLGLALLDGLVGTCVGGVLGALRSRRGPATWPGSATAALAVIWCLGASLALGAASDGLAILAPENERARHLASAPAPIESGGKVVVLVTLDTVRADALEHMPLLAARADRGLSFENARSPSAWTLPAIASIQTGLPYPEHGAAQQGQVGDQMMRTGLHPERAVLAQELQARGFATASVVTNPFNGMRYGFDRGFDHSWELSRQALRRHAFRRSLLLRPFVRPSFDRAAEIGEIASDVLDAWGDGQFFLWLHYLDAHAPYSADPGRFDPLGECALPDCFDSWGRVRSGELELSDTEKARVRELYVNDLGYLDVQLEAVLSRLDPARTLLVVTADHGEGFWEGPSIEHGGTFREPEVAVPLIVTGPGVPAQVSSRPVDTTAIFSAVLSWVDGQGLDALDPRGSPMTTPLGSLLFAQGSGCTDGTHKLLLGPEGATLYDLSADPAEKRDVAAQRPDAVERLRGCADKGQRPSDPGPTLDLQALRAMGYID